MVRKITIAALLTAITILIPIVFVPFRITIGPMSWTPASHVPIFIAAFISPFVAISVAIGSAIGFFFSAPLVIAARASTHIIFAILLALYIKKNQKIGKWHIIVLSIIIATIHGISESLVVMQFFLGTVQGNITYYIWILIGFGTFVHSMVDFWIAKLIFKILHNRIGEIKNENPRLQRQPK